MRAAAVEGGPQDGVMFLNTRVGSLFSGECRMSLGAGDICPAPQVSGGHLLVKGESKPSYSLEGPWTNLSFISSADLFIFFMLC